eukprot:scaffold87196_cov63-Phaeocystis_antarctica.AAC.6
MPRGGRPRSRSCCPWTSTRWRHPSHGCPTRSRPAVYRSTEAVAPPFARGAAPCGRGVGRRCGPVCYIYLIFRLPRAPGRYARSLHFKPEFRECPLFNSPPLVATSSRKRVAPQAPRLWLGEHVLSANGVVRATDLAVAPYTPPTSHGHPA